MLPERASQHDPPHRSWEVAIRADIDFRLAEGLMSVQGACEIEPCHAELLRMISLSARFGEKKADFLGCCVIPGSLLKAQFESSSLLRGNRASI